MSLKQEELLDMRKRILSGYEPADEEIEQILAALQEKRATSTAAGSATKTRKTAKKAAMPVDLKELFNKDK